MNNIISGDFGLSSRELRLLKGESIKPVTRREMYIRALYDSEQTVPKPITREDRCFCIAIANLRKGEIGNE